MDIIETFGGIIDRKTKKDPDAARRTLLAGYRLQKLLLTVKPNKELPPSRQYAARVVMDVVIKALARPENAAMVSLFTPCEPLTAAGITPYSVETISGYLAGSGCGSAFLDASARKGMPETLCSFHRTFLGAADTGLLPKPKFMIFTNLACDANMITFPYLRRKFGVPAFFIEVPYEKSEDSVQDVAKQLREMTKFISDVTGKRIAEDDVKTAVSRSARSAEYYADYCKLMKTRMLPGDLTSEMYAVFMSHILLGTKQAERYFYMLSRDAEAAPESRAERLVWLHLVPYLQPAARDMFNFSDRVFITACDLAYESMTEADPSKPYETMARRMVFSCYNGSPDVRIARAKEMAETTGASGAVLFAHWGCKATLGASRLIKDELEKSGLPTLILDGDGCDASNAENGRTSTRLGAFLEMLEDRRK